MERKKMMAVLLCAAMLAGTMTGCGAESANGSQQQEESSSESVASEQESSEESTEEEARFEIPDVEIEPYDVPDTEAFRFVHDLKIGWNLGNTFDAYQESGLKNELDSETCWAGIATTKEMIDDLKEAGFNAVRLPVTWHTHVDENYQISEVWLNRVQEVLDYVYDNGMYVILNIHHDNSEQFMYPSTEYLEQSVNYVTTIWQQLCERFKDYDEHLIFEAQNEPRKVGTAQEWTGGDQEGWDVVNATNAAFIDTIRNAGGSNPYRMLMIPGYGANSTVGIQHMDIPEGDNRIIVSVHAYSPYNFALNKSGTSEWNNDTYDIDKLMSDLKSLFIDKGVPAIIGEFGAMNKDNEDERVAWATYYLSAAKEIGVPCVWWDNGAFSGGGELFGLFNRYTGEVEYPALLDAMMKATE